MKTNWLFRSAALGVGLLALVMATGSCGGKTPKATEAKATESKAKVKATAKAISAEEQRKIESVVEKVKPTIVRIKVVESNFSSGREDRFVAFGSGTIISEDGYIVTNHHVAGNAVQLIVTMPNREEIPASLVGTDPATDIAVIKLEPKEKTKFPFTAFGDSDKVQVGDPVIALGSPVALSQSATLGIVSNTEMIMPPSFGNQTFELDGENVGELVRWIGHDAAIFPGNSGGPLIDMDGRIIGVNEIGMGLGGAIPGNLARKVAEQIIRNGKVKRAYVGMTIQPLLKQGDSREGVLVASVLDDSPASKAGLEPGDVITAINNTRIEGRFMEDLPTINNLLADLKINESARVSFRRGSETRNVSMTPVERPPAKPPEMVLREWGITASNVTLWQQLERARDTSKGVLVTSARPGGPVAQAKPEVRGGDIITRVNETDIRDLSSLQEATAAILKDKREGEKVATLVQFERDGQKFLTVADVGIDPLTPPAREVRKAWLPMETQPLTRELVRQLGLDPKARGVRVTRIYKSMAGEGFPLEVGDLITTVDGEPLEVSRIEDAEVFNTLIRQYKVDGTVELGIRRGGEEKSVQVGLQIAPEKPREMTRYRDLDFEFVVRGAAFDDRKNPAMAQQEFAVVFDSVTSGGWASLAGLQVGDALLTIDGTKVTSVDQVAELMGKVRADKPSSVVLYIRRGARNMFIEMEPAWDKLDRQKATKEKAR